MLSHIVKKGGHAVQFYGSDSILLPSLGTFISNGLAAGETCVVIGTSDHTIKLSKTLREQSIDVAAALQSGHYIVIEAEELLEKIMHKGMPDCDAFMQEIMIVMQRAQIWHSPVRLFGEMDMLLLDAGNIKGLLDLEQCWNILLEQLPFTLFCAYPEPEVSKIIEPSLFLSQINRCHTEVIGVGGYISGI